MTEFHSDIWATIRMMVDRARPIRQMDIVSGFVGQGATEVVEKLFRRGRIKSVRILVGLSAPSAAIPEYLAAELSRLRRIATVRTCAGLHAKMYLLDDRALFIGSANFSRRGFGGQHEAGLVTEDRATVRAARKYVDGLWRIAAALPRTFTTIPAIGVEQGLENVGGWLGSARHEHECPFPPPRPRRSSSTTPRKAGVASSAFGSPRVKIVAFDPNQLDQFDMPDSPKRIEWGASNGTKPGQVQVFCVTKKLTGVPELRGSTRIDAVVSIWKALDEAKPSDTPNSFPIQAPFKLLVRLKHAVPKQLLFESGILAIRRWPQGVQGKLLDEEQRRNLAKVLAKKNRAQRRAIQDALGPRGLDEATKRLIELGGTQPQLRGITRRRMA